MSRGAGAASGSTIARLIRWAGLTLVTIGLLALAFVWYTVTTVAPASSPGDLVRLATGQDSALGEKARAGHTVNLLLLGSGGSDAPNMTDTVIVASVQPARDRIAVISLPRDLWVSIPAIQGQHLQSRLATAYSIGADPAFRPRLDARWRTPTGAGDLASATVSMLTGLHLDGWIALNEDAFPAIINALGGITVTVPQALDDPLYPVGDSTAVTHVHFDPGPQTMNGDRALQYVRSRMTTSDTDRRRRQQQVLLAIMQRSRQVNPLPAAFKLLGPLRDGVRTNLTAVELRDLQRLFQQTAPGAAQTLNLDDAEFVHPPTGGPAAQEILLPRDGTYASLQHEIQLLTA